MKIALTTPGGDLNAPDGVPQALQGGLQDSGAKIFQTGLDLLFLGAVVLAVVFIIFSGIQWITSTGDPGKIQAAKARLLYAIIGLIVVALAFVIMNIVLAGLGKTSADFLNFNS